LGREAWYDGKDWKFNELLRLERCKSA